MKKQLTTLALAAGLAAGGLLAATPAQAADRTCRGTIANTTVSGNVVVPAGATCKLSRVVVRGDVKVGRDSSLGTYYGTVQGNIQGTTAPRTVLVSRTHVKGDVQAKQAGSVQVLNARVWGNVQAERTSGATRVLNTRIGGDLQTKYQALRAEGNGVNGNIQHEEGKTGWIVRNSVRGDVQVFKNRGQQRISYNTVRGNLQCKENSPRPVGGQNKVSGSKEDQCRTL
ncbi:hypothetical protein ACQ7DA_07590 [Zafaria sp. J156]|uniref:hypothetical protein n=1 Tax=Zafaria sp. J156 TaxID=3116490 RepID=UPI002E77BD47|nr:hypothetical protein [Zafaria sp. J156]MEE1620764.1 hypothetical protein [Zafaria sp. J156]